jgi:hypothetical protein
MGHCADVVLTATPDLDAARTFRTDLRERAAAADRTAGAGSALPGVLITVARPSGRPGREGTN